MPKLKVWKPSFLDYLGAIGPGVGQAFASIAGGIKKKREEEETAKLLIPMIEKAFNIKLGKEIVAPGTTYQAIPEEVLPEQRIPAQYGEQPQPQYGISPVTRQFEYTGRKPQYSLGATLPQGEVPQDFRNSILSLLVNTPQGQTVQDKPQAFQDILAAKQSYETGLLPRERQWPGIGLQEPGTPLIPEQIIPSLTGMKAIQGTTPGVYKYDPAMLPNLLKILPTLALLKIKDETPADKRAAELAMDQLRAKLGIKQTFEPPATARAEKSKSEIAQKQKMQELGLEVKPETAADKRDRDTLQKAWEIVQGIAKDPTKQLGADAQGRPTVYDIRKAPIGEGMGPAKPTAGEIKTEQLEAERKDRAEVLKTIKDKGIKLTPEQEASIIANRTLVGSQENLKEDIANVRAYISTLLIEFNLPGNVIMLEKGGVRLTEEDKARVRYRYEQDKPRLIKQGFNPELLDLLMGNAFNIPVGAVMTPFVPSETPATGSFVPPTGTSGFNFPSGIGAFSPSIPSKSETWEEKRKRILGR